MEECPDENELGVRDNPVCTDDVPPDKYQNITDGYSGLSDLFAAGGLAAVREGGREGGRNFVSAKLVVVINVCLVPLRICWRI